MKIRSILRLREHWEQDATEVAVLSSGTLFYVVLSYSRDPAGFSCHRYFSLRDGDAATWNISVDHRDVDAVTAMQWFAEGAREATAAAVQEALAA